jgi:hypothetical protein
MGDSKDRRESAEPQKRLFKYSWNFLAVQKKVLTDTVENTMVTELIGLSDNFESFISSVLQRNCDIDKSLFPILVTSYLWIIRSVAGRKLFIKKSLNDDLISTLKLHFKWFDKHCISHFLKFQDSAQNTFIKSYQLTQNYVLSSHHPLNLPREIYYKNFNNFLPFYENWQVEYYEKLKKIDGFVRIVPTIQKRLSLMNRTKYQDFKRFLSNNLEFIVEHQFDVFGGDSQDFADVDVATLMDHQKIAPNHQMILHEINDELLEFEENEKPSEVSKFDIEMLPILEYFLLKLLVRSLQDSSENYTISEDFCVQINSITEITNPFRKSSVSMKKLTSKISWQWTRKISTKISRFFKSHYPGKFKISC